MAPSVYALRYSGMKITPVCAIAILCVSVGAAFDKESGANDEPLEVKAISNAEPAKAGLRYYLPKNYFRFNFKISTETTTSGPYCDLAEYFFVLTKKPQCNPEPQKKVSLATEVGVEELPEPDLMKEIPIEIAKGAFK